jgi:hypothetical protein
MREDAHDKAKKAAAGRLTDAFLTSLRAESLFEDRADRGMAVGMAVMRFIVHERLDPRVYLDWLDRLAEITIIEAATQDEADLIAEARRNPCH